MKKRKSSDEIIRRKREKRKKLEKKRSEKNYISSFSQDKLSAFRLIQDDKIIDSSEFELDSFLNEAGTTVTDKPTNNIKIPKVFSLEKRHSESLNRISLLRKSLLNKLGEKIIIDFTECIEVDFAILFILKVVLEEYLNHLNTLNGKTHRNIIPDVKIKSSTTYKVNQKLYANNIIKEITFEESNIYPKYNFDLIKGSKSRKHYHENKKGSTILKIRKLINKGLNNHQLALDDESIRYLDGLLSEILNNAEDHSPFNSWYAFGNLFETNNDKDLVGEINLAIFNFGYSIYDGFEQTKNANHEVYEHMDNLYNNVNKKSSILNSFSRESIFTLTALQWGISRLGHTGDSRGTGTMKFLNSFIGLGDYEDLDKNYNPRLLVYSGNTMIKCDTKFKPYKKDDIYFLSLNKENDIMKPPEKSHLKELQNRIPGTLLIVKIYLNEKNLLKKLSTNV